MGQGLHCTPRIANLAPSSGSLKVATMALSVTIVMHALRTRSSREEETKLRSSKPPSGWRKVNKVFECVAVPLGFKRGLLQRQDNFLTHRFYMRADNVYMNLVFVLEFQPARTDTF